MSAASTSRSRPAPNISAAIPTCCSASSRPTSTVRPRCARPSTPSPCAPGRRTSSWRCAACAPWRCGCASTSGRRSTWRAGSTARPEVARVLHPALETDPGHAIWKRDFTGSSGLFSVDPQARSPTGALAAMLDGLELFGMGYSWGGFESLVDPVRLRGLPHRDATGSPAARPALPYRPRGSRRSQGRSRCRLRAAAGGGRPRRIELTRFAAALLRPQASARPPAPVRRRSQELRSMQGGRRSDDAGPVQRHGWDTQRQTETQRARGQAGVGFPGLRKSQDEIALREGETIVEMEAEIGDPVAVHVSVDIGIARRLLVAQLAGLAGERLRGDEREGLVAALRRVGVDFRKVDPVLLPRREVEDRVAADRVRRLLPGPEDEVLAPAPPNRSSAPPPPISLSLPAPPRRRSSPCPPQRASLPAPPDSLSRPIPPRSVSACAVPASSPRPRRARRW